MKRQDLIRRKHEVMERAAPSSSWVPQEPGDSVAGIIESITTATTKLDQQLPVLALKDIETGESVSVWMMGTMLENEYRKRGPKVGDWLCIKYLGMRPGRRGNQYKAFDVDLVPADDIEPEADDDAEDTSLDEWPADSDEEDHLPGPKENC